MTRYEIEQVAFALKDGGWNAEDEPLFRVENQKQDPENIMAEDTISAVFAEMYRLESEKEV